MMSFRSLKGPVFGALITLAGCGGTTEDPAREVASPSLDAQGGPTGSGGVNGMNPLHYHANVQSLLSALSVAAADPSEASVVNPALVATGLLDTAGGREVFSYAANCALPQGTLLSSGGIAYTGGGMLSTTSTSGWLTGGLSTSQKEDVLTCMIAHLNAVGVHVPIFLSGPSVTTSESSDDGDFSVEEAIWQAKIPGPGMAPIYHAWPRTNLLAVCGLLSVTSWVTRICGSPLNTCGVVIRYDQDLACSGSNGIYTCNGKPAVQTTLQDGVLCTLLDPLL